MCKERDLYYGDSTEPGYSYVPSSNINLEKLCNGEPPFLHDLPNGKGNHKKKILLPYICWNWNSEKTESLRRLKWLNFFGFQFYFYRDDMLISDINDFRNEYTEPKIKTVSPNILAKELNIPIDTIIAISTEEFRSFINNQFDDTPRLPITDNAGLDFEILQLLDSKDLALATAKYGKKFTRLRISFGFDYNYRCVKNLSNLRELILDNYRKYRVDEDTFQFSDLPTTNLKSLTISNSDFEIRFLQEMLSVTIQLEELILDYYNSSDDKSLKSLSLKTLKKLIISHTDLTSQSLNALLERTDQLEELTLKVCYKLKTVNLNSVYLKNLKKLTLRDCNLSAESLQALLENAEQLDELIIYDCKNLGETNLSKLSLKNIKKIQINGSNLSAESLQALLGSAEQLEELIICDCKNLATTNLAKLPLKSLRKITIKECNLSAESLQALLENTEQLTELEIRYCNNFNTTSLTNFSLKNIKKININGCNVNTESLQTLLADANLLEELIIHDCKNLNITNLSNLYLKSLKKMTINYCNLNSESLQALLHDSNQLEELNINDCDNLNATNLNNLYLRCLKKIAISSCDLNTESLQALLENAEQLGQLKISYCKNLNTARLTTLPLNNLKNLEIYGCNLDVGSLQALLQDSHKLEELEVDHCNNLDAASLSNLSLKCLRELTISYCNLNKGSLQALLENCEQLNELNIRYCKNLQAPDIANLTLTKLETLKVSCSSLNTESLKAILKNTLDLKKLVVYGSPYIRIEKKDFSHFPNLYFDYAPYTEPLDVAVNTPSRTSVASNNSGVFNYESSFTESKESLERPFSSRSSIAPSSRYATKTLPQNNQRTKKLNPKRVALETKHTNKTFFYKRQFVGNPTPHPTTIREKVFSDCDPKNPFLLLPLPIPPNVIDGRIIRQSHLPLRKIFETNIAPSNRNIVLGLLDITVNHEWMRLPSVSPEETVQAFFSSRADLDVLVRTYDGWTYVCTRDFTAQPQQIQLEILIEVPLVPSKNVTDLPKEIQDCVVACRGFRSHEIKINNINELLKNRVGRCELRTIAFKTMLGSLNNICVQIIQNNAGHAFAEVYYKGAWITCDLGGYPADLEIDESVLNEGNFNLQEPPLRAAELSQLHMSERGEVKPSEFFENTRQLSILTLHDNLTVPSQIKPDQIETLTLIDCAFDCEQINNLLSSLPSLKTFIIKHARIPDNVFQKINLSFLKKLEWVELSGDFIGCYQNLKKVMQTSPNVKQIRWVVESIELDSRALMPAYTLQEDDVLRIVEYKNTRRPLPLRYYPQVQNEQKREEKCEAHDQKQISSNALLQKNKRTLFESNDVIATCYALEEDLRKKQKPFFRVTHPDQLKCQRRFIQTLSNNIGRVKKGPGGPLYDFIQTCPEGVLIIDYSDFKPADIAQFNSLYDDHNPTVDGIAIPSIKIIGLIDPSNPNSYDGADFYSRFQEKITDQPVSQTPLSTQLISSKPTTDDYVIELTGITSYSSYLLGYWALNENGALHFEKGELQNAVESKKRIIISNPPLEKAEFIRLVRDFAFKNPDRPTLNFYQGLEFETLKNHLVFATTQNLSPQAILLNESRVNSFLRGHLLEEHRVQILPGIIAAAKENVLDIFLTTTLTIKDWYSLLSAAKKANKILKIFVAPGVSIPSVLSPSEKLTEYQWPLKPHTEWILREPDHFPEDAIIIEIDELTLSDLLSSVNAQFLEEKEIFQFSKRMGFLEQNLNLGHTVVLKGRWPEALRQNIETFVAERLQANTVKGKLILVGKEENTFACMPPANQHTLKSLPPLASRAVSFDDRASALNKSLDTLPIAYLTGPTGCGKTQFMKTTWQAKHHCFHGEDAILNWIKAAYKDDNYITLFIDEANLAGSQWSLFAGLYNNPPSIFYKGEYYPLSKKHRVVFAGNPNSYSAERNEMSLLEDYPHTVLEFQPIPLDIDLREMNVPVLIKTYLSNWLKQIEAIYLKQLPLTSREVVMMALLSDRLINKHPDVKPENIIDRIAYSLLEPFIPAQNKYLVYPFKPKNIPYLLPTYNIDFTLIPTMEPVVDALYTQLMLRDARMQNQITKVGGLGGMIIEGSPGIGKSDLVVKILIAQGLQPDVDFYFVPVSFDQDKKCESLLKAFHEGKIVVIDEINSGSMLERLLNTLLDGDDLNKQHSFHPGFLLIGTQNPVTMRGRKEIPLPLKHRLQQIILTEPTRQEAVYILTQHYHLPIKIALDMEAEYYTRKQTDQSICFRDIQRWAKQWNASQNNKVSLKSFSAQKQIGQTCKITALANVEIYFAKQCEFSALPLHKLKQHPFSIRQLAKQHQSKQGEILEWSQWENITKGLGYTTKTVNFENNFKLFLNSIVEALQAGNLPIIAFAVDEESGQPDPFPYKAEQREHASVITGYNPEKDQFTLKHWGSTYEVDAVTLFNSNQSLVKTRTQEHYKLSPKYKEKFNKPKYFGVKKPGPKIKSSIVPKVDSGFQSKLLIVQSPKNELQKFIDDRNKLIASAKKTSISFFKPSSSTKLQVSNSRIFFRW